METKTLEEVIWDLKAQYDSKASAVAELLEDMRFNEEAKDFNLADCAAEVADMGEWGQYAARQLTGEKPKTAKTGFDIPEICRENIRLYAAAPDLLAALEALSAGFADGSIQFTKRRSSDSDAYHPANTMMCAALAKAKGE